MKNKSIFPVLLLVVLILSLGGCIEDEETATIYISQAGNAVDVKFVINDEPHNEYFNIAMVSPYPMPESSGILHDIAISMATDEEKVGMFNAEYNTNYSLLPEGSYQFPSKVILKAGEYVSEDIPVTLTAKGKIEPFQSYLLPISITMVEGGNKDVSHQTIYFIITGSLDASDMVFLNRDQWSVVEVSSEELTGEGPNNGASRFAFDGKGDTFWHTQWQNGEPLPPHYIIVDMGQESILNGFSYLTRNFPAAWPKECTIEISQDGESWSSAGQFTDLPASGATEFRSFFPKPVEARYFRMTINAVYGGRSTHVAEINVF